MSAINGPKEVQAPIDPTDTGTAQSVNELDVVHVEKLLNAIERLRRERDDLRRSLQFLEMEHKFSTEALEKRLAEVHIPHQSGTQLSAVSSVSRPLHESNHSMAAATYAILLLHSQTEREQCEKLLSESIEREQYSKNCAEAERKRCSVFQEEMDIVARQMKKLEEQIQDSEYRQEIMVHDLEAITGERDELISQLEARDTDEEEMKTTQRALRDKLEEVEIHLDRVSRSLEIIESERDSLVLQVKNLTSDLEIANEELADAESRYSDLQFHQLSTMTSSEVTQTLRKQIEDLEGRVMRRTEQVGIHQHDIHRLETNLRLQEERMVEMTMELETLGTQKEAMLEDCADARDARDEALVRIEALEEDLETLEFKLGRSERALNTTICLLLQTRALHQESRTHIAKLETELRGSQSICKDMAEAQASTTHGLRQMVVAFATSQLQCSKVTTGARKFLVEKDRLLCNLALANERIEEQESSSRLLVDHASRPASSTVSSSTQTEFDTLGRVNSAIEPLPSAVEMQEAQKELEKATSDLVQETECLRKELSEVVATLEQERTDKQILEDRHAEALDFAQREIDESGSRVQDLMEEIKQLSSSQESLRMEKERAEQELVALRGEFECSSAERVDAETLRRNLTITTERLSKEILLLQEEREELIQRMKSQADANIQQLNTQKAEFQSQVDDSMRTAKDRTQEVEILSQELNQERQRFQESDDKHVSLMKDLETAHSNLSAAQGNIAQLQSAIQLGKDALAKSEEEKVHLHQDITSLEAQIQKSLSFINSLQHQIRDG
jgi:myosin protein heavy chain